MQSKAQLRQHYRDKRKALTPEEQRQASKLVATRFIQSGMFKDTHRIALYLANDGELQTNDIIHACWDAGKQVFLPVLHPFSPGHLVFFQYTTTTKMHSNKYGIEEPKLDVQTLAPVNTLDTIMLPLVSFDEMGNRLGMGGGYYDRTLAQISNCGTKLIGLAHDCQMATNLPIESWDIPLNAIMTPTQTF